MAASCFTIVVLLLLHTLPADSAGLRGQVNMQDVEASLFAELAKSYRSDNAADHIASLESSLSEMLTAVPRETDGTINHAVVRYVLHRFFVKQHGWFIRGLEPGTGVTNSTEGPQGLQDLQEWVPSHLQRFIEKLHGNGKKGIGLRDLTTIASTLDDLIHKEVVDHLKQALSAVDISSNVQLDDEQARLVLEVWMMIYMLGGNFKVTGRAKVMKAHEIYAEKIKDWDAVQEWIHKLKLELFPNQSSLNFSEAVRVVEEAGRRYGKYNDKECGKLKEELLSIESRKAGRVRLTEFYKKGLGSVFDFNEKIEYLRTVGAIDESDPSQPHVIVPNYVSSRPNCLVASDFYVICCRNECEDLLGSLEQQIASEMAEPDRILKIVSGLSTSTVSAPRNIPESQVNRLQSIAAMNGGAVPLHGRLFAQWLHHLFPRECPYPHGSGATSPHTPDEWMQETGQKESTASQEEIQERINSDTCAADEPKGIEARKHHRLAENELPWDASEELLQPLAKTRKHADGTGSVAKRFVSFAVLSSLASSILLLACKSVLKMSPNGKRVLPA